MEIEERKIGPEYPPYLIAEMSNNHLGSVKRALAIIESAKKAGADAIKIQTYDADSLTIDCSRNDFLIKSAPWKGKTYYQLYKESALPLEHTKMLFEYAREIGITIFSSPFGEKAVDLLMELDCPAYKIASFETMDFDLLKMVARTGKPVLVSTGISSFDQIEASVNVLKENGARDLLLFHCTSQYPAKTEDANVKAMNRLKKLTDFVGLSDHFVDDTAALASVALGGCAVEKHFTVSREDGGPDASFSIEEAQLRKLKIKCTQVWESLGSSDFFDSKDRPGKEHGRSLYIVCDVKKGEKVCNKNTRSIRPGYGLSPVHKDRVIGKTFKKSFKKGTALNWECLS